MATRDRRARMESDLVEVSEEVLRAQGEADAANARLARLQKEQRGLQAALAIMDGKEPEVVTPDPARQAILDTLARLAPGIAEANAVNATPSEPGGVGPLGLKPKAEIKFDLPDGYTRGVIKYVVDGKEISEDVILEPGMVVGKNSFGEDVIMPAGAKAIPMAEPAKPEGPAQLLPPITNHEGFDSVEDMLDG